MGLVVGGVVGAGRVEKERRGNLRRLKCTSKINTIDRPHT